MLLYVGLFCVCMAYSGLLEVGNRCWTHCEGKAGYCTFCGTGKCCRKGYKGNGCTGKEGHKDHHVCISGVPWSTIREMDPSAEVTSSSNYGGYEAENTLLSCHGTAWYSAHYEAEPITLTFTFSEYVLVTGLFLNAEVYPFTRTIISMKVREGAMWKTVPLSLRGHKDFEASFSFSKQHVKHIELTVRRTPVAAYYDIKCIKFEHRSQWSETTDMTGFKSVVSTSNHNTAAPLLSCDGATWFSEYNAKDVNLTFTFLNPVAINKLYIEADAVGYPSYGTFKDTMFVVYSGMYEYHHEGSGFQETIAFEQQYTTSLTLALLRKVPKYYFAVKCIMWNHTTCSTANHGLWYQCNGTDVVDRSQALHPSVFSGTNNANSVCCKRAGYENGKYDCSVDARICHDNAECTNVGRKYSCKCKAGFVGDGTHCTHTCAIGGWNHNPYHCVGTGMEYDDTDNGNEPCINSRCDDETCCKCKQGFVTGGASCIPTCAVAGNCARGHMTHDYTKSANVCPESGCTASTCCKCDQGYNFAGDDCLRA